MDSPASCDLRTPMLRFPNFQSLVGCRGFQWGRDQIIYDMFVVDGQGTILKFSAQGERKMAAVEVPGVGGRFYVHRLVSWAIKHRSAIVGESVLQICADSWAMELRWV